MTSVLILWDPISLSPSFPPSPSLPSLPLSLCLSLSLSVCVCVSLCLSPSKQINKIQTYIKPKLFLQFIVTACIIFEESSKILIYYLSYFLLCIVCWTSFLVYDEVKSGTFQLLRNCLVYFTFCVYQTRPNKSLFHS